MTSQFIEKVKIYLDPTLLSSQAYRIFLLIMLVGIGYFFEEQLQQTIIIGTLYFLLFNYLFLNIIFNYGSQLINYIYTKKNNLPRDTQDNFTLGILQLSFFLNHFIYIMLIIHVFIIEIQNLLTSISIVAVAFVLIFKEYISNFLHGLNLMFSKDYRVKDTVKVGDSKGKIVSISFSNVQLKTDSGDIIYIPNSIFLTKEVTNFSKTSLKSISFEASILKQSVKDFERNKQRFIEEVYDKFTEHLSNKKNIQMNFSKVEKNYMFLNFDITLVKHTAEIERELKSYILTQLALKFKSE